MISLYQMTVLRLGTFDTVIEVELLSDEAPSVPDSKNFALQVLVESHWTIAHGYFFTPQPNPETELVGLAEASSSVDQLKDWASMMHGERVEITEGEYEKFQLGGVEDGVRSWGMKDGIFYKHYAPHAAQFCEDASKVIEGVGVKTVDDRHLLKIRVDDPALLEHLTIGVNWESAVRDMKQ